MAAKGRVLTGCLLTPVILIGAAYGKICLDWRMYDLPGEVLASSDPATRELRKPMEVAKELDAYVQPRFEILRDKNFGAMRLVYRSHAGIVQLKVETPAERTLIANVNEAHRDYAICLLHCAPAPGASRARVKPHLGMLYFNQLQVTSDIRYQDRKGKPVAEQHGLNWEAVEHRTHDGLPKLLHGKEHRASVPGWDLLMRPVLASKRECLGCHTNATPGSTLGAMVYAVRQELPGTRRSPPVADLAPNGDRQLVAAGPAEAAETAGLPRDRSGNLRR